MEENKDSSKYGHITKEYIENILNDIVEKDIKKDRKFRMYFGSQEAMDNWNKQCNKALKEHIKNESDE